MPTTVSKTIYSTPQEAEQAFYDAFHKGDLETMMSVWADDDDIYCIHPGGPRIAGLENVRQSWMKLFTNNQSLSFQLHSQHVFQGPMLAVHSVYEQITVLGQGPVRSAILATNMYVRTERGWRMAVHHASPAPNAPSPATENTTKESKTLH